MPVNLKTIFPRGSKSFFQVNPDSVSPRPDDQLPLVDGTLEKEKGKGRNPSRYAVRIVSYRAILADADALCAKYFVDALRYASLLYDDTTEDITFQISQKKVQKKTQEKTLIEIEEL